MIWLGGVAGVALAGIDVNGTPYATLSEAVAAAVDGDTLVFDGGTYEGGVQVNGIGLTFVGNGSTLQASTGTEVLRLSGGASLTASDLTFSSTVARGIDAQGAGTLDLTDVTFLTAAGSGNGGGISADGPNAVVLRGVTFDHTGANDPSPTAGRGGALFVRDALTPVQLSDVSFDTTHGRNGGAIYLQASPLECTRCTFAATDAATEGGAIYATGSAVTVSDSTFTTTTAGSGGAIRTDGPLTVTGSTFCGTTASSDGGAILSTGGGGSIANSVFLDSSGGTLGRSGVSAASGTWTFVNNHVLSAFGSSQVVFFSGATVSATNNLFAYNDGTALSRSGGAWAAGSPGYQGFFGNAADLVGGVVDANDVTVDPRLAGFVDDGICGNDDLWPGFGSPLLDAGDPALSDPDGGRSDIGAFGGAGAPPALFEDGDGDGADFLHDCDDAEPLVRPGLVDVCDGLDNDCSGTADDDASEYPTWFEDCDGDGQGDLGTAATQCDPPSLVCGWLAWDPTTPEVAGDCDDGDPDVYLGADEYCSAADEDCDGVGGLLELGVVDGSTFYVDADLDGFGDPLRAVQACQAATGLAANPDDCDDGDALVSPSATDACGDGVDQDCSGVDGSAAQERTFWTDGDGDGYGDELALPVATCETTVAGAVENDLDCDDGDRSVNPDATETCDGVDQDCDDLVDDVGGTVVTYYADGDGDGYGDDRVAQDSQCGQPDGFVAQGGDCDDGDRDVNPGRDEVCNDVDDDCDSLVDTADDGLVGGATGWLDDDGDGYGRCGDAACDPEPLCALGEQADGTTWVDNADDCDDAATDVNPGASEIAGNTVDENCDGKAAEPPGGGDDGGGSGCNCDQSSTGPGVPAAALLLLAVLRRRR